MKDDSNLSRRVRVAVRELTSRWRPLPNLLILGGQKCGSTSLFNYLIPHPQVARGRTKEVHYFDLQYARGERWYRAQYPLGRSADRFVIPDATPYYLFDPRCAERAAQVVPGARLIALLRCPVERAYSQYRHSFSRGYETRTFSAAIREEIERIDPDKPLAAFKGESSESRRQQSFVRRGIYATQIAAWLQHFPRDQLLLLDANDFFSDTAGAMRTITDFLHIAPQQQAFTTVFKKGTSGSGIAADDEALLQKFYAPHNARLANEIGFTPSWL